MHSRPCSTAIIFKGNLHCRAIICTECILWHKSDTNLLGEGLLNVISLLEAIHSIVNQFIIANWMWKHNTYTDWNQLMQLCPYKIGWKGKRGRGFDLGLINDSSSPSAFECSMSWYVNVIWWSISTLQLRYLRSKNLTVHLRPLI